MRLPKKKLQGKLYDSCAIFFCHYRKTCASEKHASILMALMAVANLREPPWF